MTSAQRRLAAQRADAARDRLAAAQRRRRFAISGGALLVVILVIAGFVIAKASTGAGNVTSGAAAQPVAPGVLRDVGSVPPATLDAVGAGSARTAPTRIQAPALRSHGKPEVLYIGAEYCPYCAAERWAVAVALSRFGTLHGLGQIFSSSHDVYPSTPTLSFHDASLTSRWLSFTPKELQSNKAVDGQYTTLDTLTPQQQAIVDKYNAPPYVPTRGSIPFVDLAGKYVISGASYDPALLQGKTHLQIAQALSDPGSPIAQAVDGTANLITASLCVSTAEQPAAVCHSSGVTAAAKRLNG